jgi:carbamoyl-phosphate synthase large subunit
MKSTGEVMGIAPGLGSALARALVATGATGAGLPTSGTVFVSVANRDKRSIVLPASRLAEWGFRLLATRGTAAVLSRAGIAVEAVRKVSEGRPNVVDLIRAGDIDLVVNTPFGRGPRTDGSEIRTAAAAARVPCVTTLPGLFAALRGIEAILTGGAEPRPLQEHHRAAARAVPEQLTLPVGDQPAAAGRTRGATG